MSKYDTFQTVFDKAVTNGRQAMVQAQPTPMVVQGHANPLDDNSKVTKRWYVPQGVCGFAWVHVSPGNCSFARWLVKHKFARKSYQGGVDIWVHGGGQSMELKQAYAKAMAETLRLHKSELEIPANGHIYQQSRID